MDTDFPQLSLELCRERQGRFRELLQELGAGRAILIRPEHVQYFTGFRPHFLMHAAVVLEEDRCLLIAPNEEPERHAATEVISFEAQWLCTLRQDQEAEMVSLLRRELPGKPKGRLAVEGFRGGSMLCHAGGADSWSDVVDVEPDLLRLRRRKDPDEVDMIRHAIRGTEAMYARAREIIEPGVHELQIFSELQAAAVAAIGEPLTATGNDYQCNSPGGPPRARVAADGELYILDLGPAYRGYFADNCRTFSVGGNPSEEQMRARDVILGVLQYVESEVRPGKSCPELFQQCKAMLDEYERDAFFHHLGHGIGLYPHEAPHLNPAWEDQFEVGDVFTVEPGLYCPSLRAGIRIEENYLVTEGGLEKLTSFSTEF